MLGDKRQELSQVYNTRKQYIQMGQVGKDGFQNAKVNRAYNKRQDDCNVKKGSGVDVR